MRQELYRQSSTFYVMKRSHSKSYAQRHFSIKLPQINKWILEAIKQIHY